MSNVHTQHCQPPATTYSREFKSESLAFNGLTTASLRKSKDARGRT
jgi:hypothetical protein